MFLSADMFNALDLPALSLALAATSYRILLGWDDNPWDDSSWGGARAARQLSPARAGGTPAVAAADSVLADGSLALAPESITSIAVLLMWLRQLRLLIVFPSMAPLVRMLVNMLQDVLRCLLLLAVVLVAFSAALTALFAQHRQQWRDQAVSIAGSLHIQASASDDDASLCARQVETLFAQPFRGFWLLFEGGITGDGYFECVRASDHPLFGRLLLDIYMIISVVLLLNMIVAMMGKTFDSVWQELEAVSKFQFVRAVHSWSGLSDAPPPLNLLSLPYRLLLGVYVRLFACWCFCRVCCRHDTRGRSLYERMVQGAEVARRSTHSTSFLKAVGGPSAAQGDLEACEREEKRFWGGPRREAMWRKQLQDAAAEWLQERFAEWESTAQMLETTVSKVNEANAATAEDTREETSYQIRLQAGMHKKQMRHVQAHVERLEQMVASLCSAQGIEPPPLLQQPPTPLARASRSKLFSPSQPPPARSAGILSSEIRGSEIRSSEEYSERSSCKDRPPSARASRPSSHPPPASALLVAIAETSPSREGIVPPVALPPSRGAFDA